MCRLHIDLKGVGVMAIHAGLEAFHVLKAGIVRFTLVLVAALRQGAELSRCRGVVVDVDEGQVRADCVISNSHFSDGIVQSDGGSPALVALHAAGLIAQALHLCARREDDVGQSRLHSRPRLKSPGTLGCYGT